MRTLSWRVGAGRVVAMDVPVVMGILNVTPDSFADGGLHLEPEVAAGHAQRMVEAGARVIDVGGESTRPGAGAVSEEEQIRRVVPVIRAIRGLRGDGPSVAITVDTTRSAVARAALDAGADGINDVSGGMDDGAMLSLAASRGAGVVLMHRVTTPARDTYSDRYERPPMEGDVVETVGRWLGARVRAAMEAGVPRDGIAVDPGLGFGKSVEQNLALIAGTRRLQEIVAEVVGGGGGGGGVEPGSIVVVSGLSRKSFVGRVSLGRESTPAERGAGTIALTLAHVEAGARVARVHDVGPTVEALRAWGAVAWGALGWGGLAGRGSGAGGLA